MNYKVSVIIPFYNAKQFIESSVKCMISQSLRDFEVIYINDGSTDGGDLLLKEKIKFHKNMICIDQENKGLGESRNVGVIHSSGEYIYFLDIDDCIVSDALETMLSYATQYGAEMVVFNSINVDECVPYTKKIEEIPAEHIRGGLYTQKAVDERRLMSGREYVCKSLISDIVFPTVVWIYLFERQFLVKNDLIFQPIVHEDNVFTMDAALKAQRIVYANTTLHWRRIVPTSIMNQKKNQRHIEGALFAMEHSAQITKASFRKDKELAKCFHGWNVLNCGIAYTELAACDKEVRKKYKWKLIWHILKDLPLYKIQLLIKAVILL